MIGMGGDRTTTVIIGIGRLLVCRWRILLQVRQQNLNGFLELWVVTFSHRFWIELHLYVRRNALVFHFPLVVGCPETTAGSGHDTSVHQRLKRAEESDQSSPRAFANQGADLRLAKVPGHRIATRSGVLVDDHRLRSG